MLSSKVFAAREGSAVRIEFSVPVPREHAFDRLADVGLLWGMADDELGIRRLDAPMGIGAGWHLRYLVWNITTVITGYNRPFSFSRRITGAVDRTARWSFEEENGETRVSVSVETYKRLWFLPDAGSKRSLRAYQTMAELLVNPNAAARLEAIAVRRFFGSLFGLLAFLVLVPIYFFYNPDGTGVSPVAFFQQLETGPSAFIAAEAEPHIRIYADASRATYVATLAAESKVIHTIAPLNDAVLADLSSKKLRYQISRSRDSHWLLTLVNTFNKLAKVILAFWAFGCGLILRDRWCEVPLLPRHHVYGVVLATVLAVAAPLGFCGFVGSLLLVQDRFVPRSGLGRTDGPSLVLASPLRHLLLPPAHGELVYVSLPAPDASSFAVPARGDPSWPERLGATLGLGAGSVARVWGSPGDAIEVDRGGVKVNGVPIDEPGVQPALRTHTFQLQLGGDEYFLARDVRDASDGDERAFLVVRGSRILGAVMFVLLPGEAFGTIEGRQPSAKPATRGTQANDLIQRWLTRI